MTEPTWKPSTADVAAQIPARVQEPGVGRVDDFSEDTEPTKAQVEAIIGLAVREVASSVGTNPCSEELRSDAGAAAALRAAMRVEVGFWPEQTTNAGSSFKSLESLWKDSMRTLVEAVEEQCGGAGEGEGGAAGEPSARGSFDDGYNLIGRSTPEW